MYLTGKLPRSAGYQMFKPATKASRSGTRRSCIRRSCRSDSPATVPPDSSEQRSVYYTSSLHSGELNFMRMCNPVWRPYCGVRYMKFDDEINDHDQPGSARRRCRARRRSAVTETDTFNMFDLENNLIGFQVGSQYDIWQLERAVLVARASSTAACTTTESNGRT